MAKIGKKDDICRKMAAMDECLYYGSKNFKNV
jgi:hypothetical protein